MIIQVMVFDLVQITQEFLLPRNSKTASQLARSSFDEMMIQESERQRQQRLTEHERLLEEVLRLKHVGLRVGIALIPVVSSNPGTTSRRA